MQTADTFEVQDITIKLMASAVLELLTNENLDETVSSDALTRRGFSPEEVSLYGHAAIGLAARKIKGGIQS